MKRRAFTPNRPAREAPRMPLGNAPTTSSSNPRAHIVTYKPTCGVPGCREPAMVRQRCRCGAIFARCHEHEPSDPVAALRAAHRCP